MLGSTLRLAGFSAHPRGLSSLFFTEMWERFSYYGMRAILVLYLVLPVEQGGMGFSAAWAAVIYGNYTMCVYLLCVLGGYVADRAIGAARAVMIGGTVIATGHFVLALGSAASLYAGLACVALGTSLLKPNVTALVSRLYPADDVRRDAGFSLFYMGINVGAFVAPLICGYLAQGEGFRSLLTALRLDARSSWHWGFGAAGVGMLAGLAVFLRQWAYLRRLEGERAEHGTRFRTEAAPATSAHPFAQSDRRALPERALAIAFFCLCAMLFWAMGEQAGSSLNLFADRYTRTELFGWQFPSSWFQSVSAGFVILLAPVFSALWLRLGSKQPSSAVKAVIGLAAAAASFVILAAAARSATFGSISPLWLLCVYFVQTVGELCLNPVGQSSVARLAPKQLVGALMGLWFVAIAMGSKAAGLLAEWFGAGALTDLAGIFLQQAGYIAAGGAVLALLVPRVKRILSGLEKA